MNVKCEDASVFLKCYAVMKNTPDDPPHTSDGLWGTAKKEKHKITYAILSRVFAHKYIHNLKSFACD